MDNKELLKGIIKEQIQPELEKMRDELEAKKEQQVKFYETPEGKEMKERLDDLQGKVINLNQNTGKKSYIFKGFNQDMRKNLVMNVSEELREVEAKRMIKALTEANTGAYATATEYGNALLGLAELKSVFLNKARVIMTNNPIVKLPVKGTRSTIDTQAFGTANADAALTMGQLTFTIDKRVGAYEVLNNDLLADDTFDVVGQWVEPAIAEGIGQTIDGEVIKKTEFTTDIAAGGTAAVSVSGTTAIAAAITYANLVEVAYSVELERGLAPEWFMPRGAMKDIVKLVDSVGGLPIFAPVPISGAPGGTLLGYNVNIVSAMDNTPDNGNIRVAFGDPKQYIIMLRQGVQIQWNPYVSMKEGMTQVIGFARADGNIVDANAFGTIKRVDA